MWWGEGGGGEGDWGGEWERAVGASSSSGREGGEWGGLLGEGTGRRSVGGSG
jgi:hypothetical protein